MVLSFTGTKIIGGVWVEVDAYLKYEQGNGKVRLWHIKLKFSMKLNWWPVLWCWDQYLGWIDGNFLILSIKFGHYSSGFGFLLVMYNKVEFVALFLYNNDSYLELNHGKQVWDNRKIEGEATQGYSSTCGDIGGLLPAQ